ncbi:MAG: hypothetical protein JNK37_20300 [Verrucomicrobiales bacterium]|nr:hypothetical protein [Verrucomicrobiales bacterium]
MNFPPLPTPPELFRLFERGDLSREQLQAAMALHARDLIAEMTTTHRHPAAAWMEQIRNRAAAARLARRHGAALVREILSALGNLSAFPPALLLWNAAHRDVPLHCFIRSRHEPIFRILRLRTDRQGVCIDVEWGEAADLARESITFARGRFQKLEFIERRRL